MSSTRALSIHKLEAGDTRVTQVVSPVTQLVAVGTLGLHKSSILYNTSIFESSSCINRIFEISACGKEIGSIGVLTGP